MHLLSNTKLRIERLLSQLILHELESLEEASTSNVAHVRVITQERLETLLQIFSLGLNILYQFLFPIDPLNFKNQQQLPTSATQLVP
jgi:hypothetical protein